MIYYGLLTADFIEAASLFSCGRWSQCWIQICGFISDACEEQRLLKIIALQSSVLVPHQLQTADVLASGGSSFYAHLNAQDIFLSVRFCSFCC